MLVAVDTGGTKTLVASFLEDGTIAKQSRFPTPQDETQYISELSQEIIDILEGATPTAIIVGLPGRISPERVLCHARNLGWKDFNVKKELSKTFDCPILIENDANLAGLAETRQLKTIPAVSLYLTFSTGVGTGIIVDGKIEPHFQQSEGGQMLLERDGALRTWESFASGKSVREAYGKPASEITSKSAWKQIAKNISSGIAVISPLLRPEVIIIGGSIGMFFEKYESYLDDYLTETLKHHYVSRIMKARHPELAVIYGCYYYALDSLATA
jgi:predicted NBD/HSP70 family sugar kinase